MNNSSAILPKRYFVNLPVDFLLIGGASILLFTIFPYFQDGTRTDRIIEVGLWLTWIANWPHFAATSFRLYGKREHLRQYPITAIAAPLLVLAFALGSFAFPLLVAPLFVKMFLLWSPYHYSGQTLGISLLYGRRAGHRPYKLERFLLASFIYGTFLMRSLGAEISLQGTSYYGVQVPGLGIPRWLATVFTIWTYSCAILLFGLVLNNWIKTRKAPPVMYLLPSITQWVWFVVAGAKAGYSEFVPFFHGVQYLVIAWAMQVKEESDRLPRAPDRFAIGRISLRWYIVNACGGALLFFLLPHAVSRLGISLGLASAVILTAIQIHHFFVDGVIWKLKSSAVISPLLVNIPSLLEQPVKMPQATEAAA